MKKILSILCMVLVVASCAKEDEQIVVASGEGAMRLSLAAGSEITAEDNAAIKIYKKAEITNEESGEVATEYQLVRRYTSADDVPDKLALLAGEYKATVTVGEKNIASFEDVYYYGETEFEITAGEVEPVVVDCKLQSTIVRVEYDESVGQKLSAGFTTTVAIAEEYDQTAINKGDIHSLKYTHATGAKDGYFMLPENQTSLVWKFVGNNPAENDGQGLEISKSGKIENVLANARYTIKLKYSKDAPGGMLVTATVESDPHQVDDNISFSPDPTIVGVEFDISEEQSSVAESLTYKVSALAAIETFVISADGVEYDLLNDTVAGITLNKTDDMNYTVTIADDFFVLVPGGKNDITFIVEDVDGGKLEKPVTYNVQGVLPMTESDYDLWFGDATLKALVLNTSATSVKIAYSTDGSTWSEVDTVAGADGLYTAAVADFAANKSYYYKLIVDGKDAGKGLIHTTANGAQLPNGDFEIWNSNTQPGGLWSSGNNNFTTLMTQSTDAHSGSYSANLKARAAVGTFAAGNLFTGSFELNISTMSGKVTFGKDFSYTARPTKVTFWMKNNQGQISHGDKVSGTDPYSAMVLVTDGTTYTVDTTNESTFLTADNLKDKPGIIAYGYLSDTDSNSDWVQKSVELTYVDNWRSMTPKKVSVSFATSAYGDYFCGSTDSWMYVDDIVFHY